MQTVGIRFQMTDSMNNQKPRRTFIVRIALTLAIVSGCADHALAQPSPIQGERSDEIRGFTEPFRTIELASDETGAISTLNVDVGSIVQQGEIIATLDDRVQKLQVEQAKHLAASTAELDSARINFEKRQAMLETILKLQKNGGTTPTELVRAEMELAAAKARLVKTQEDIVNFEIDLRKAEVQLDRRWIRSPFASVVSQVHRREGEFLSPLHPEVVTLVQIDNLLALFNIPSSQIHKIQLDQEVVVEFADGECVKATVHSIGVQTDAESSSVLVKVKIDNADGMLRSGEQCKLIL